MASKESEVRQRRQDAKGGDAAPVPAAPAKRDDGSLFADLARIEAVVAPVIFTLLAAFVRLYRIGKSNRVVWDEAHFGKFGSFYLNHTYYFDVHPPLGKMLCGLSGYLAGYNGSFMFTSGMNYPEYLNFAFMRAFNAAFSIVSVPVAYFTAKALGLSLPAVWLVATMVCLEQSLIVLARFILLDSMLICFTTTAFLGLAKIHQLRRRPFSAPWLFWFFFTGASIGLTTSVKMVGLFVTALVGLYTACDLWLKLGDRKQSLVSQAAHLAARALFLIVVPLVIFAISYKIHFALLYKTGDGAAMMSSLFRANLEGESIDNSPLDVAYGARITLKNAGLGGQLLHSHVQTFPGGSQQQQVTTYGHADANNEWLIETARPEPLYDPEEPVRFLHTGDHIRLIHAQTGRNLHSHEIKAPINKNAWEVSGYGNLTIGDAKDNWIVEIVESLGDEDPTLVHPLSTAIRLRNEVLGCYLTNDGTQLPEWGFRQGEVVCANLSKRNKNTWWNVEQHWNERLPIAVDRKYPKSSFLRDFVALWVGQMRSNNALITDSDRDDSLASSWWEWPIVYRGLRMCGWGNDHLRYLLLGTPTTLWLTTLAVVVFPFVCVVYVLRWQRQYVDFTPESFEFFVTTGVLSWLGWLFQYVPFIVMGRVTYLHHYMPALYFAIFVFAFLLDWFTPRRYRTATFAFFILLTVACFYHFRHLCFGMSGDPSDFNYLRWFDRWRVGDDLPLSAERIPRSLTEVVGEAAEVIGDAANATLGDAALDAATNATDAAGAAAEGVLSSVKTAVETLAETLVETVQSAAEAAAELAQEAA